MTFLQNLDRLITQPERSDTRYFWITLLLNKQGSPEWRIQSQWSGFTDDKPRREIRKGRLFFGDATREEYKDLGDPFLLINDEKDIAFFRMFGGHALIAEEIGRKRFPRLVEPHVSLRLSAGLGFRTSSSFSDAQHQHAPSKKLRMKVLDRDGRRCAICGRSPKNHVDLELHVHHVIPWGSGGVTEEENLITLCHTCHEGLDPHFDFYLLRDLSERYKEDEKSHEESMSAYHSWFIGQMEKYLKLNQNNKK